MRNNMFIFVIFQYVGLVYLSKQRCMCEDRKYVCIYIDRTYFIKGINNNFIFTRNLFNDVEVEKSSSASSTEEEILNRLSDISHFGSNQSSKCEECSFSLADEIPVIKKIDELGPYSDVSRCNSPEGCSSKRAHSSLHSSKNSLCPLNKSGSKNTSQNYNFKLKTPPNSEANSQSSVNSDEDIQDSSLHDSEVSIQSSDTSISVPTENKSIDRYFKHNNTIESESNSLSPNLMTDVFTFQNHDMHLSIEKPVLGCDSHVNSEYESNFHKKDQLRSSEKHFFNIKDLSTSSETSSSSDKEHHKSIKTRHMFSSSRNNGHADIYSPNLFSYPNNTYTFKSRITWLENRFTYINRRYRHILARLKMLQNFSGKKKMQRNLLALTNRIQLLYKEFTQTTFSKENQFIEFENNLFNEENFMTELEIALCDLEY
ncbi:hypothetical protein CWI38_0644p0030 [Hamiltosporidium tvaerminnensis]|uniref:Uncharacterized protein n=1 Tax=Hamiltosporidium tvaerminnensis TaxID=1176355 RepID=A0A4Q9LVL5_9MICR|nr:hypothetical protein CWI38_0644p0030 [Hamiltosporidium tvaerminnensis]